MASTHGRLLVAIILGPILAATLVGTLCAMPPQSLDADVVASGVMSQVLIVGPSALWIQLAAIPLYVVLGVRRMLRPGYVILATAVAGATIAALAATLKRPDITSAIIVGVIGMVYGTIIGSMVALVGFRRAPRPPRGVIHGTT